MKNNTKVVLLGTGTPNPVPERSGPCVAVVVSNSAYLVDFGTGVVRQAEKARQNGIDALLPKNLKTAFLTHLHSDHTLGYPDLILTPWVLERDEPLKVFGPSGLNKMTDHILQAYGADVSARKDGLEKANEVGYVVESKEISEGVVYQDDLVTVEAFKVNHPPFESYGYRFITEDKTVVISGDTTPCENLIKYAMNCDVLVHEVYSAQGFKKRAPKWQKYHSSVHTSSIELGIIAEKVRAKQVVMYHQLFMVSEGDVAGVDVLAERIQEMIDEIKQNYSGPVFSGNDLDVF